MYLGNPIASPRQYWIGRQADQHMHPVNIRMYPANLTASLRQYWIGCQADQSVCPVNIHYVSS
jgi:hypothetical protein